MKNIESFVNRLAKGIKQELSEKKVDIINAYPSSLKPTVLTSPVIAIGLESAKLIPDSIDEERASGEICVFADIFIPAGMKSTIAIDIFNSVCKVAGVFGIVSVSAERLSYDKLLSAYVMKTSYKFNDELIFGGE